MKCRRISVAAMLVITTLLFHPQAFGGTVCTSGSGCVISVDWALDEVPDHNNHTCDLTRGTFFPAADGFCTLRRAVREAGARENNADNRPITIEFTELDGTDGNADDVQYDAGTDQWTLPIGPSTAIDHWILKPFSIIDPTGDITIEGLPSLPNGTPTIFIETNATLQVEMTGNTFRRLGMFGGGGFHFKETGNALEHSSWGLSRDGQSIVFEDELGNPDNLAGVHGVKVLAGGDDAVIRDNRFAGAATKAIETDTGSTNVQIIDNWIGLRGDGTVPAVPMSVECETQPIPPPPWTVNPDDWYGGWGIGISGSGATVQGNVIGASQNIRAPNDTPPLSLEIFGANHTVTMNTIGRDAFGNVVGVCGQGIKFSGEFHQITSNVIDQARKGFENTKGAILWSDTTIPGNIAGGNTLQGNLAIDGAELDSFERYFEMGGMIHDQTRLFEPGEVTDIDGTQVSGSAAAGSPCPNCIIDFYRDDLDTNEEGLEYLGSATANGSGDFNFTMPAPLDPGFGLRTTSTSAADNVIPNSHAGTTSEMSTVAFLICPTQLDLVGEILNGTQVLEATEKITTNDVTIASGAIISFIAGQIVELGDLTSVEASATFTVEIDPNADCIP